MSTKNYFAPGSNYYDHHREITFNNPGANAVDLLRAALAEDVEPIQAEPVQSPSGELFKYIHVAVTSEDERLQIHRMVSNIVHLPKMQQVCDELYKLMKNKKVLCSINPDSMLVELRRMGLPDASQEGFSDKNFSHYYKAPKLD
ncbi:MAG: hypothetical protein IKG86_04830 [Paludibacteraceae bacterium]|nr:hypothetical protein [Paludibacteraceae bacterium]